MEVSRCPRRGQRRGRLPSFSGDVVRTLTTLLCPLLRSFSSYSKGQRSVVSAVAAPGRPAAPTRGPTGDAAPRKVIIPRTFKVSGGLGSDGDRRDYAVPSCSPGGSEG